MTTHKIAAAITTPHRRCAMCRTPRRVYHRDDCCAECQRRRTIAFQQHYYGDWRTCTPIRPGWHYMGDGAWMRT
jgi:hypothetical protein